MDTLGGYRLVRKLGAGTHSDVWLGSDGAHTAAIKVFRSSASKDRIDAEIESLGRASGRHVMRLEDLAMGPKGTPCLILQRLSSWSLARILEGVRPAPGEAVTILAPLALAVAQLHRVGVSHGQIAASSLLFDSSGGPVLCSFSSAELFGDMPISSNEASVSPLMLRDHPGVSSDIRDLAALCLSTLDPQSQTSKWLTHGPDRDPLSFVGELTERLFRSSSAAPVHFSDADLTHHEALIPVRMSASEELVEAKPLARGITRSGVSRLLHLPDGMAGGVVESMNRFAELSTLTKVMRNITESLKPVRKPVWIMAGGTTAMVIFAVAILPTITPGAHPGATSPSPTTSPTQTFTPESSSSVTSLLGDDPIAAASVLLAARIKCFGARSVLCLDTVNQQGSAAMEADTTHVRLLQTGGADDGSTVATFTDGQKPDSVEPTISIVERLGDTVLLSVTYTSETPQEQSLSLLLIKGSEGWRVRDFVPLETSPLN